MGYAKVFLRDQYQTQVSSITVYVIRVSRITETYSSASSDSAFAMGSRITETYSSASSDSAFAMGTIMQML